MKKLTTYNMLVLLLPIAMAVAGVQLSAQADPVSQPTGPASINNISHLFCPSASQLTKDPVTRTWFVHSDWKSHGTSLATSIDRFLGAQWSGSKVGQLICLYSALPIGAFQVRLYFNSLVKQPIPHPVMLNAAVVNSWAAKNKTSYMNCYSSAPKMCSFEPVREVKQKSISETLQGFKTDDNTDQ